MIYITLYLFCMVHVIIQVEMRMIYKTFTFLSFYIIVYQHAVLAQPVERTAFNRVVVGSNPTDGAFSCY